MRAAYLREIGGPHNLRVEEIEPPVPGPGETLVKVARAALNRRDVFLTRGLYAGIQLPCVPGSDAVGTVVAHGVGATGPVVGARVVIDPVLGWGDDQRVWRRDATILGMPHQGTFAEFVAVPSANVHPAPASLSDDQAAAIPLGGLTAYRAVVSRGRCTSSDVVLLTGVGGGVQTFALLFAKKRGATVIVTSSSDAKLARARELGADVAINSVTSERWEREVRAYDGGPSLIVDSVGGATFAKALGAARFGARVVSYGGTAGDATIRMYDVFWKQLEILGTSMGSPRDFAEMLAIWDGTIAPAIDTVYPLADVAEAAARLERGDQFGKVCLAIA